MSEDNFDKKDNYDPYALDEDYDAPPAGSVTGGNPDDEDDNRSENGEASEAAAVQGEVNSEDKNEDGSTPSDGSVRNDGAEDKTDNSKSDIGSDIIRGHINTIILRALYERDKYGYEIMSDIEQKSHGQYSLKQPTLYSALKRLESQGYIKAYWKTDEVSNGGRRKYFKLTESGKEITEKNLAEWEYSRTIIDSLISDRSFDFSQPAPTPVDFTILRNFVSRVPVVKNDDEDDSDKNNGGNSDETVQAAESRTQNNTETKEENISSESAASSTESEQPAASGSVIYEQILTAQSVYEQTIQYAPAQNTETVSEQTEQTESSANADASNSETALTTEDTTETAAEASADGKITSVDEEAAEYAQAIEHQAQPAISPEEYAQAEARRVAHENYLRLISEPVRQPAPEPVDDVVPNSENVNTDSLLYNNRPETERDYKNLIDGIFRRAVTNGSVQTTYHRPERVEIPRQTETQPRMRLVDRGRADGVAVYSSASDSSKTTYATKTTYNKGLTLLKCSAITLSIAAVEFILCFIFMQQLQTTWVYPTAILLLGLLQFVVFGVMSLNGYGRNCVRPTTNGYISSCVILTVISILIISALSFLLRMNPTSASDVLKMIVIPSITALNITLFAVWFKLFTR